MSDNIFRFVLTMLALDIGMEMGNGSEEGNAIGARLVMGIGIVFALPWIMGFALAGSMSDRFSKARVTQGTKVMEICSMGLACIAFGMGSYWLGLGVMFLMSLQSAFFSPSKYGILPELMPEHRVGWGNGILQGFTFAAILVGTIVGPFLYGTFTDTLWVTGVLLVIAAFCGLGVSLIIRPIKPADPSAKLRFNPWNSLKKYGPYVLKSTGLRWAFAGSIIFWVVAVALQSAVVQVLKNLLEIDDAKVGLGYLPVVVGNGVGSFLVSIASRKRVALWPVLLGGILLVIGCGAVWGFTPGTDASADDANMALIMAALGIAGLGAGMFMVPLGAYILENSEKTVRGGIWSILNLLSAVAWLVGAVFFGATAAIRGNPADTFLACAVVMATSVAVMAWRFPDLWRQFLGKGEG